MFYRRVSERQELRLLELSDAPELFALTDTNRTYLRQWLPWLDSVNKVEDTRNFIESTLQQLANEEGLVAAICNIDGAAGFEQRKIVGLIGFNLIERHNRIGYIGYWLAESYQSQGIMTSACQSLIDYAFTALNLNRVVIGCASKNQRSRAIPERLGFTHEGVAREAEWLYDRFVDHEIYALLNREWNSDNVIQ